MRAYISCSLNGNPPALQRISPVGFFSAGFNSGIDAVCSNRGSVTAAANGLREARNILRLHINPFHILDFHANILSSNIASDQTINISAKSSEVRLTFVFA